jgi:phosphatidylserine/phosphatidylglycerophosphate/cardiolipin synthase-like enzyme/outer membrane protein OmpA-like peptidoglycan-associated protein
MPRLTNVPSAGAGFVIDRPGAPGEAWQGEISRSSPEFVRWAQQSLNTLLGLNLAVDGIMGPQTRSAVRSFQQQRGLTVDGIVGPQTEAALHAALATPGTAATPPRTTPGGGPAGRPAVVLDRFPFDSTQVQPFHEPPIEEAARRVVASQTTTRPVRSIVVVGHTDPVGSAAYNLELGRRRAEAVMLRLRAAIDRLRPGLSGGLRLTTDTRGEAQPIAGDAAASRRAEVFLVEEAKPGPPGPGPGGPSLDPARWTAIMMSPDLRIGNFVNFLVDGAETFREMHRAILTATNDQHYIYLLGWWLSDDFALIPGGGAAASIRDLFSRASSRGVQIRAMLWDQFGTKNSAEVKRIHALANGAAILDNHTVSTFRPINVGSHHQKVLVVKGNEGLIAFCGGIDINPDRVASGTSSGSSSGGSSGAVISSSGGSSGNGNPMHDVHCRIVGPATHDLLTTFIRRWDAHPGHGAIDRGRGDLRGRRESRPAPLSSRPVGSGSTGGTCAVRITRTYNTVLPLAPGTTAVRERSIRQTLITAIRNARRFIYMEDQYLVSLEAAAELNAALDRLQHVTILIPDSRITDMPRVWEGRLNFINRLTRGPNGHKARVFILSSPPNRPGTPPSFGPHTYVHTKTWVFDDELAHIGSANCNRRGWEHDSEVNAVIFEDRNPTGPTFAQRLRMKLWAEHLNTTPAAVADGVASARLWLTPPAGARIRPYDPRAGTDSRLSRLIPWSVIDPSGPP